MKSLFAINFAENTIVASKTTLKKASIPNSPEYKELMKLMKQNPGFAVTEKYIKEAAGKKTYKGLNDPFIKKYISIQPNAAELNKQYENATKQGKFSLGRKWFLDTFKNFDMDAAKTEIEKAILAEISGVTSAAEVEKTLAFAAAPEQKKAG